MPNWVFNSLVVSGDKSELDRLATQLNQPVTTYHLDFEYESDSPRKVKTDENGNAIRKPVTTVYNNPVFSFMNVVAPAPEIFDEYYYGETFGKANLSNPDGSFNNEAFMTEFARSIAQDNDWWHWNVRNWGTKWDISVADGQEYADTVLEITDDGSLMYRFQTAWSPVFEVLEKLSAQYPSLTFDYEYEEEQGWGGEATISNGDVTMTKEWDIPNSHADYKALDRECSCEYGDYEYAYPDCPVDTTKYRYDEDSYGWVEIDNEEVGV